jgi:(p)ppGpp synthase/HD superfamily hydrolase
MLVHNSDQHEKEKGMPTLEDTIIFVTEAHRGQVDRGGQPYALHPIRMMTQFEDEAARTVALLHDVVEDTPTTLDDLRARGYNEAIIEAVDALTRRENETYEQFILRIKPIPLARRVKLADLRDNMDIRRTRAITEKDAERFERYRRAWFELTGEG